MPTNAPNPYEPPSDQLSGLQTGAGTRISTLVVPPILTIGATLLMWVGLAMILSLTVSQRNAIFFWSASLIFSLAVSTFLVHRLWRRPMSATSIGLGYALFGIVFCLLEGDTSKGTDLVQASVVYGTLMAAPLVAFLITWNLNRLRYHQLIA